MYLLEVLMVYPLKFNPVYKDYIWGGRNFEKLGKKLPQGIVAESWEVSCHPDGTSIISNGALSGTSLPDTVKQYGRNIIGNALPEKDLEKFPLIVKLIDANNDLSVQVHPDDCYAFEHENHEYGKNEAWYIISAKPGAKLIYDVAPKTTREVLAGAVKQNRISDCLKYIDVCAGDVIDIPAGLVHAICNGIMLAEVQQNSNTTYRLYDFDRTDSTGNKRPLHIDKALDVIDFNTEGRREKFTGISVNISGEVRKTYLTANRYFSMEHLDIHGSYTDFADGSRFYIYTFLDGRGIISYKSGDVSINRGESVLIPASIGEFTFKGNLKGICSYVPDIEANIIAPLKKAGCSMEQIHTNVGGIQRLTQRGK
jgi:mannose-6-phosphate isomerase